MCDINRRIFLLALGALMFITHSRATSQTKAPYGQSAQAYILTFSEEFNRYNDTRWNDHLWYEDTPSIKNYAVEQGKLKIWPQRDTSGNFFKRSIDTDGKFAQTYGYFEIEAKLPKGRGTWPAFWLFAHPEKRRPEIDIMEAYAGGIAPWGSVGPDGVATPRAYGITVWRDAGLAIAMHQHDTHGDLSAGFHKYALQWEPDKQIFYLDGKRVLTVSVAMADPMYIVLSLWFGSDSGTPDASTPEGKFNAYEINYVRAWQFRSRRKGPHDVSMSAIDHPA